MKRYIVLFLLLSRIFAIGNTVEIAMENDIMGGTDRHYTHGTKISYSYPIESDLFKDHTITRIWSVGQYMYTPSDITIETMQFEDRPYAGWLYGASSVSVNDDKDFNLVEISLGVTGDWSGAGDTQKQIHKWIDSKEPKGWDTQLDSVIGFDITMIKRHKWKIDHYADIMAKGGITVGSIHVNASLGASLRLGFNLPDDFGIIRMEPSSRNPAKFGVYGVAEVSNRLVGYNYFIEGDSAERVYGIHTERSVIDVDLGCGAYYGRINFVYLYNIRSKEFKEQEERNEFGTVSIAWSY